MISISPGCCLSHWPWTPRWQMLVLLPTTQGAWRENWEVAWEPATIMQTQTSFVRETTSHLFHYIHLVRINQSSWSQQSIRNWKDFQPDHIIWNIFSKIAFHSCEILVFELNRYGTWCVLHDGDWNLWSLGKMMFTPSWRQNQVIYHRRKWKRTRVPSVWDQGKYTSQNVSCIIQKLIHGNVMTHV